MPSYHMVAFEEIAAGHLLAAWFGQRAPRQLPMPQRPIAPVALAPAALRPSGPSPQRPFATGIINSIQARHHDAGLPSPGRRARVHPDGETLSLFHGQQL